MRVVGIGNILQKDDGFGVYASTYLKENYNFTPKIEIINGGVEGINLFSVVEQSNRILILDTIELNDTPSSIYLIPVSELNGYGLNSGGAHEIGIVQCFDMLELQGKPLPKADILGIVPQEILFDIALSDLLRDSFDLYIKTALRFLEKEGIEVSQKDKTISLEEIIKEVAK